LIMPEKDGRETLDDLRRDPATCDIPVVICTGVELDGEETRDLLQHASAILSKRNLTRTSAPAVVREALDSAGRLTTRTEGKA
jgi:CheY-like chemotaxis protein